jgi:tetratricopeptide (TPR) repeat protein
LGCLWAGVLSLFGEESVRNIRRNNTEAEGMCDLKRIEKEIEDTLWDDLTYEEAMRRWKEAEEKLLGMSGNLSEQDLKERDRILSYCLLRQYVDEPLQNLRKMLRCLEYALRSGDKVQIMRAYGSLSGASRNCKDFAHAHIYLEKQMEIMESFSDVEKTTYDVQQGYGWYHIFWARLHFDKNRYEECLRDLDNAEPILDRIDNYAGMRRIWSMRADCFRALGRESEAEKAFEESKRFDVLSRQFRR